MNAFFLQAAVEQLTVSIKLQNLKGHRQPVSFERLCCCYYPGNRIGRFASETRVREKRNTSPVVKKKKKKGSVPLLAFLFQSRHALFASRQLELNVFLPISSIQSFVAFFPVFPVSILLVSLSFTLRFACI